MADGKWIDGLRADLPAEKAARLALDARLTVVSEYLPRALHHVRDTENVHQLRVGTRRADAALRIFRGCVHGKEFRKARTRLRALRHAAGAARDWDVFALAIAERRRECGPKEYPGLDHLFGRALASRAIAQGELAEVARSDFDDVDQFIADTVAAVRPPETCRMTLRDVARPTLAALHDGLRRAASADLTDYENLHRVRIAGKRLRYAMEVFAGCFAPPFKDLVYPQIEAMQDILGRANDSHVAARRLTEMCAHLKKTWSKEWPRLRPGVEGILRFHQRRLPQERRHFLSWWKRWQTRGEAMWERIVDADPLTETRRAHA
jgi:CHAD domain-containing protein